MACAKYGIEFLGCIWTSASWHWRDGETGRHRAYWDDAVFVIRGKR